MKEEAEKICATLRKAYFLEPKSPTFSSICNFINENGGAGTTGAFAVSPIL
jgi:hypothetical protein